MFVVWCLPTTKIKPHQREKAVEILDILGKWSLVDSYVMILMLIAFRMKINLPPNEDDYNILQINLFVYPAWGFVTLVVGTILSLGCSQVILAAERYVDKKELLNHQIQLIIEEEEKRNKEDYSDYSYSYSYSYSDSESENKKKGKKKGKLSNIGKNTKKPKNNQQRLETVEEDDQNENAPSPKPKKKNENDKKDKKKKSKLDGKHKLSLFMYCKSFLWKIFLSLIMLSGIIMFIFGTYMKAFSFKFVGLAGWALKLVNADQYREYSSIDLAIQLPKAAENQNSFGIRITQAVYILVTNLMPIIHLVCLSILWFIPLKLKHIHFIERACEYMYSWACLDVFVISIVAAVMEISQLALFMVGDRCDIVDIITKEYFSQEDLIKDHLTCFDVVTTFLKGSYIIIAAAIFHTIATIGIGKCTKKLNRDLAEIEKEKRDQNKLSPLLN
ncbi:hypothetical protein TVAG_047860 [Trichomonas vaginalis G3]|uniref:Transmembrane protein n=1 Tax=Trichomonas vaginalis (strain ATCC PRA-98 / G3) TaxID=412133 RepID=A2EZG6_TRIV3|nr:paraquat-inducible protein A (PqiA) family [Trichomonas vaginalis G3]EAY01932.1 hypothetical protein TVAG_047860 [Trichomonas vaginalis G3]KAI5506260.1 paraquat-inducible protein A (PqiA) family [Trichomonas vaginalis G3]|eukprot:XP_001314459.1 hypothetical protein [Trichomonas vaginalis G3]